MRFRRVCSIFMAFLVLLTMGGCATLPTGPSVMTLPSQGKSFEEFKADDAICRQWASQQIGISPQKAVNQNTASGAVAGTLIGGGLGAAIGSAGGQVGLGAAIGAGAGMILGILAGADRGYAYGRSAQRKYDIAYMQCMYAKGNLIPGVREPVRRVHKNIPPPPSPGYDAPPDYQERY